MDPYWTSRKNSAEQHCHLLSYFDHSFCFYKKQVTPQPCFQGVVHKILLERSVELPVIYSLSVYDVGVCCLSFLLVLSFSFFHLL